jgi:hypothetical protein
MANSARVFCGGDPPPGARPFTRSSCPVKGTEYTAEAAKAGGPDDASLGMLWHKLSELPVASIAKICGRARRAGSELA